MNIMYLCDEYPPGQHGGIGTSVQLLAREMAHLGHTVVVAGYCHWGYGGLDEFTDQGVQVFRFRRRLDSRWFKNKNSGAVRGVFRLLNGLGLFQMDIDRSLPDYKQFLENLISRYNIDIVEAPDFNDYVQFCTRFTPFPRLTAPTVIKLNGSVTYFSREEGNYVKDYIQKMDEAALQQADAVVSVSSYTAEKTAQYLHYTRPIAVIPNGIDVNVDVLSTSKQKKLVIFTGSLVRKKGIYQLMKAWNLVHKKAPEARLWLLGKGAVAKMKKELDANASDTVTFKGHLDRADLLKNLSEANIAVFPSYAEAFALAPLEAMACGCAVVNSNRTSGPELVEDGVNGLLVDPDNIEEIANKIIYLLENDDFTNKLSEAGRETVKHKVAINIIAEKNLEFYKSVVSGLGRV